MQEVRGSVVCHALARRAQSVYNNWCRKTDMARMSRVDDMASLTPQTDRTGFLANLAPQVQQQLVEFGAPLLLTETESRLALAERKIAAFERKYGMALMQLSQDGLPDNASLEMHEDYIEWAGWQRTREEAHQLAASLKLLLEKSVAPVTGG